MNQMHQEKFKKVEHVRQNHLMLGVLGSDRPKRTNLVQRCTVLLFLSLCILHWDFLPARGREQKITQDCFDAACD